METDRTVPNNKWGIITHDYEDTENSGDRNVIKQWPSLAFLYSVVFKNFRGTYCFQGH